jgi:hypothetical protein
MICADALRAMRSILEKTAADSLRADAVAHYAACGECGGIWKTAQESTCQDLADFLHDYLEGDLKGAPKEVFERHLDLCGECKTYLDTYRTAILLCCETKNRDACEKPLPDDLIAAILAARSKGQ